MIRNIFYILALLIALGGALIAYKNTEKLEFQQTATKEVKVKKDRVLGNVEKEETTIKGLKEEIKTAEQGIADTDSAIASAKAKQEAAKKTLAKYEAELITIQEELEGFDALKTEIDSALGEIGIANVADIPDVITELKKGVQEKEDELENLELIIGKLGEKLESEKASRTDNNNKLASIKTNIAQNSMTGTVTSVNTEWGFVVINKGASNSSITDNTELLVQRGGRYVGQLKVTTLNPTQAICDLDLKGFKGGSLVRPGDTVILKQTSQR